MTDPANDPAAAGPTGLARFKQFLDTPISDAAKKAWSYTSATSIGDFTRDLTELASSSAATGVDSLKTGFVTITNEDKLQTAIAKMQAEGEQEFTEAEQRGYDEIAARNPHLAEDHRPALRILIKQTKGRIKQENAQLLQETLDTYGHVAGGTLVGMWVASQFLPPMHPAMFPMSSTIYLAMLVKGPVWTKQLLDKTPLKGPAQALDSVRQGAVGSFDRVFKGALGYSAGQLESFAEQADKRGLTPEQVKGVFERLDAAFDTDTDTDTAAEAAGASSEGTPPAPA